LRWDGVGVRKIEHTHCEIKIKIDIGIGRQRERIGEKEIRSERVGARESV
jgi:hypothetical protein